MSYTLAALEVSPAVFDEVQQKLKAAGYDHACLEGQEGSRIDMSGILLTTPAKSPRERCLDALELIGEYGWIDGGHHKQWVLDQAVRILTGPGYADWLRLYRAGDEGPETYEWDEGIAP